MTVTAKIFRPAAKVTVYTENGPITLRTRTKDQGDAIYDDILAIQTTNDMSQDCGTFQISLVNRNQWDKKIAANDLITIQMWRDSSDAKNSIVMYGLVSDIRKDVGIEENNVQRGTTISGQNFTKVLMNFNVGYVPMVDSSIDSLGWMQGTLTDITGKDAAGITKEIWDKIIFKTVTYNFANGKSLKDLISFDLSCRPGESLQDFTGFVNYTGDLNGFLQEVSDFPFNEMFWEVRNNKNTFVLRETPFNKDKWTKLPLHTVTDDDIISYDRGRGDVEAYSIYSVGLQSFFDNLDPTQSTGVFPIYNPDFFDKYGIRLLQWYTYYLGIAKGSSSGDLVSQINSYQHDIYNWNIMNPTFYNGTYTIKGQNYYKLGDRLLVKSKEDGQNIEYYITSVQQNFINKYYWQTSLGVTRGLPESGKKRFSYPWGSYKTYKSNLLGKEITKSTGNGK